MRDRLKTEREPENTLYGAVLYQAFVDATYEGTALGNMQEKRKAHAWIVGCCSDFRMVCGFAGMDADFLSDSYKAGRVDRLYLKNGRVKAANEEAA